jgi:hypothetical protein
MTVKFKKYTFPVILIFLFSGCGSLHYRMNRLKERRENFLKIEIKGSIKEAKNIIRQKAEEINLAEVPQAEKEDFIFFRSKFMKNIIFSLFLGPVAGPLLSESTRLGFYFEEDGKSGRTAIIIVEEVSSWNKPYRFYFSDDLKSRN